MDFKQYLREERVDELLPLIGLVSRVLPGVAKALPGAARTATTAIKPATQALQTATKVTKNVGRVTKPIKAGGGAVKKVGQELGTPAQQQQTDSLEERLAASTHYITNRWVKLLGEEEGRDHGYAALDAKVRAANLAQQKKFLKSSFTKKQEFIDRMRAKLGAHRKSEAAKTAKARGTDNSEGDEG